MAGLNASVNMVLDEEEEEEGYVNVARGEYHGESREGWKTPVDSWLEMEAMEEEDEEGVFYVNALVREGEDEEQDGEDPVWCLAWQCEPSLTEDEGGADRVKAP
jgi:hypothetical protein